MEIEVHIKPSAYDGAVRIPRWADDHLSSATYRDRMSDSTPGRSQPTPGRLRRMLPHIRWTRRRVVTWSAIGVVVLGLLVWAAVPSSKGYSTSAQMLPVMTGPDGTTPVSLDTTFYVPNSASAEPPGAGRPARARVRRHQGQRHRPGQRPRRSRVRRDDLDRGGLRAQRRADPPGQPGLGGQGRLAADRLARRAAGGRAGRTPTTRGSPPSVAPTAAGCRSCWPATTSGSTRSSR